MLHITITTIITYSINKAIHPLVLLSPIQQTICKHMISVKYVPRVEMTKRKKAYRSKKNSDGERK